MGCTRRAVLARALLAPAAAFAPALAFAQAARPSWLATHPGMQAWDAPQHDPQRFLDARIETSDAPRVTAREWLGGRPGVVAVWATWCGPCLAEKRPEAELNARLAQAGSRAQIKSLLAYDRARLPDARRRLADLGAGSLETARATEVAEQALLTLFGIRRSHQSVLREDQQFEYLRTTLPFTLLFDADGNLLGQSIGRMMDDNNGSYWRNPTTFDLLQRLGA